MPDNTTTDAMPAASRVVDGAATEGEIDLTKDATAPSDRVTWTAPPPEPPKPAAAKAGVKKAKVSPKLPRRSGTSIMGAVFGVLALVLIVLLGALTAVLWNRVSDLEDQVEGRTATQQPAPDALSTETVEALEAQVADLQATVDSIAAAQQGGVPPAEIAALTARLDATVACINTYMDTVAAATNANASYSYVPC